MSILIENLENELLQAVIDNLEKSLENQNQIHIKDIEAFGLKVRCTFFTEEPKQNE